MDSSAQNLLITDPEAKRLDVPIKYMECDSHEFENGDQVLVELEGRDWQAPKIIGFRSKPRHCPVIVKYQVAGWYRNSAYQDPTDPATYAAKPSSYFRDKGVTQVDVGLWAGDSYFYLYTRDLQKVLDATLVSELPPRSSWGFFPDKPRVVKQSIALPTVTRSRNDGSTFQSPRLGTEIWVAQDGSQAAYPNSKPPDSYVLEPEKLTIQYRVYPAVDHSFYDIGASYALRYWSSTVDPNEVIGEATVEYVPEDFPEVISWLGVDHVREEIVSFARADFLNGTGPEGPWRLDLIGILYRPLDD